jgi:hypothetical protein
MGKMSIPKVFLHLEGSVVAIFGAFVFFFIIKGNWIFFILGFLAVDLSMLGYLSGPKFGAIIYNFFHIYLWPALITLYAILLNNNILMQAGTIWLFHIGLDRALGYGIKYPSKFKHNHLKKI